jgi:hypothetical protein
MLEAEGKKLDFILHPTLREAAQRASTHFSLELILC